MGTLQAILDSLEITQTELASRLGIDQSTVSRWCTGSRQYSIEDAEKIATALGITAPEVLGEIYLLTEEERFVLRVMRESGQAQRDAIVAVARAVGHPIRTESADDASEKMP